MMELQIYTPTDDQFITAIEWNYDELKEQLAASLAKYQGLSYAEDEIATMAKKDRANLNKFKKALDEKRLEIKERLLASYVPFDTKIKELQRMVDSVLIGIDVQIKSQELERKQRKIQGILAEYLRTVPERMRVVMPLEKVMDERWKNATYALGTISKELEERQQKTEKEMETIRRLGSQYTTEIMAFYLESLDLGSALAEGQRLEQGARQAREYEARREAEQPPRSQPFPSSPPPPPPPPPPEVEVEDGPLREISFKIYATRRQEKEFGDLVRPWIRRNGIRIVKN
ncbi:MAG: DUF1351 domain-containing protein [Synergistaceae bacterium]|jgi:hypothetical protein|nr:DUF1351 domain-containing protein [Synergistaceae bacterium]